MTGPWDGWKTAPGAFAIKRLSEGQRHHKNPYLEECEVLDGVVEVSLFVADSPKEDCEVYFSFGIFYGIVHATAEDVRVKFEVIRREIEEEKAKHKEPCIDVRQRVI